MFLERYVLIYGTIKICANWNIFSHDKIKLFLLTILSAVRSVRTENFFILHEFGYFKISYLQLILIILMINAGQSEF